MMSPDLALASQVEMESKVAAVCSSPPSWVGTGMIVSCVVAEMGEDMGSMYRYICVVNRLGTLVGVIQRVNGMRLSERC